MNVPIKPRRGLWFPAFQRTESWGSLSSKISACKKSELGEPPIIIPTIGTAPTLLTVSLAQLAFHRPAAHSRKLCPIHCLLRRLASPRNDELQSPMVHGAPMRKLDKIASVIGMTVACLLTWLAYYSNSHPEFPKLSDWIYLLLFPGSIGYMASENATRGEEVFIVIITIISNGILYCLASFVLRRLTKLIAYY